MVEGFEGQVDVVVDVVPQNGATNPSGTLTIAGIPATATVLRAWFITTAFANVAQNATPTFDGNALGTKAADDSDPGPILLLQHYRFDVTAFVPSPGNGNYPYSVSGTNDAYGDILVVVFQDSSLPTSRIEINDGAENLENATSTTSFAGFGAGAGRLIVFTEADDTGSGGGESLAFNAATVLGPGDIYSENQGPFATLLDISVTVVAGTNTMSVTTGNDQLGLHLGILVGPPASLPTPTATPTATGTPVPTATATPTPTAIAPPVQLPDTGGTPSDGGSGLPWLAAIAGVIVVMSAGSGLRLVYQRRRVR
jgi:hypothetical protein